MTSRPSPTDSELAALAKKYSILARLRREHAAEGAIAPRRALKDLAREFPGALRELDTTTLEEIDRREKTLTGAAAGGPCEAWMAWMVRYHATMRAALFLKARLGRTAVMSVEADQELARRAGEASGVLVDLAFLRAVREPPGGRLNVVVFDRLGAEFGVEPDAVWRALFPSRRPARWLDLRPRRPR
ncbi:MAG TPA: hypothetical protein VJT73_19465 [Polyangiaceae bacterium]|nr:hypothetical protein [Polyangiaceae bacterium]